MPPLSQPSPSMEIVETQPIPIENTIQIDRIQLDINLLEQVLYFVFDLETTDFVPSNDEIIEIAGYF
jgi:DNA polymerase III alpha subunit (gram-positive type)